jgi:hypothetical protein
MANLVAERPPRHRLAVVVAGGAPVT